MDQERAILNELLVDIFNQILSIQERRLKEQGVNLTMSEIHVLEAVAKTNEPSMSNIANRLRVTVGTLTTAINRLVKKGYCSRYHLEDDLRKVYVKLTHKGEAALSEHEQFHADMIDAVMHDLNVKDTPVLIEALGRLLTFFKSQYK